MDLRHPELRVDLFQRREIDLELLRDVGREALDLERVDGLKDVRVATLDSGRLAGQMHRHLDADLLFQAHLVEVDVDRA